MLSYSYKSSLLKSNIRLFSLNKINESRYDIIVSGAGMVGSTFACLLGIFKYYSS